MKYSCIFIIHEVYTYMWIYLNNNALQKKLHSYKYCLEKELSWTIFAQPGSWNEFLYRFHYVDVVYACCSTCNFPYIISNTPNILVKNTFCDSFPNNHVQEASPYTYFTIIMRLIHNRVHVNLPILLQYKSIQILFKQSFIHKKYKNN